MLEPPRRLQDGTIIGDHIAANSILVAHLTAGSPDNYITYHGLEISSSQGGGGRVITVNAGSEMGVGNHRQAQRRHLREPRLHDPHDRGGAGKILENHLPMAQSVRLRFARPLEEISQEQNDPGAEPRGRSLVGVC